MPVTERAHDAEPGLGTEVRRVRKAYEQVYDELRRVILSGARAPGERLPTESRLASDFGVSRGTVREALRLLAAENLIRSAKGAGGGTFVTLPTVAHISETVRRDIALLSETGQLSLDQFLEVRELLEIFAVRQAAVRRTERDVQALRETLAPVDSGLTAHEQYVHQKDFHVVLIDACANPLLQIAAQPLFAVLHTHLGRSPLPPDFAGRIGREHDGILSAIELGDADEAERLMREHLTGLADVYRTVWPTLPRHPDRA